MDKHMDSSCLSCSSDQYFWHTQAVQWRKKTAKRVHDSKDDISKLCSEGISIAPKLPEKPTESWAACPSQELDRGTGNFLQTLPLAASLIHDIIQHVLHMQTSKYKVSYELTSFKVNTTWDKYKPLRIPPQLSAVNPFQHLKASTEAFMYAWLCSQLLSCHVSLSLSSTPCTHRMSVLVFIYRVRSYQQACDKAALCCVAVQDTLLFHKLENRCIEPLLVKVTDQIDVRDAETWQFFLQVT